MKKILSVLLVAMMVCAVALPVFATEASFTVFSDEEYDYYYFDMGSSNSGGSRFHDGWNYIIYEFPIAEGDTHAQLSWHIRNQYRVSVTNTDPDDPDAFEIIHEAQPTEEELADGRPYWGDYGSDFITVHDLSKWCENNTTGKIWVMMSDADESNGWGGYIYNDTPVTFWSGSTAAPEVEQPKTKEDFAAETLAKYNFADGAQYFVCSTAAEAPYIYAQSGSNIDGGFNRFNDATGYVIYQFDVKAADTAAWLHIALDNQYDVRVANSDPDNIDGYTQVLVAEQTEDEIASGSPSWGHRITTEDVLDADGNVIETITHYPVMDIDLSSVLNGSDGKLYVYVGDCAPDAGWGGMVVFNYPVVFSTTGAFFADAAEAPAVEETPAEEPVVEEVVETPAVEEAPVEVPAVEEVVETPVVVAPQTFDAAVIAALAVVTALGGAVVSKKRH